MAPPGCTHSTVFLTQHPFPARIYTDTFQLLSAIQSLQPKTDVFIQDDIALNLVCLAGTLPIVYKSNPYNIPVKIWLPTNYPNDPPIVFVTPTSDMLVKTSNHVGLDGRIYHPFLAYWNLRISSTLVELVSILTQIFEAAPPVYAKPKSSFAGNISNERPNQNRIQQQPQIGSTMPLQFQGPNHVIPIQQLPKKYPILPLPVEVRKDELITRLEQSRNLFNVARQEIVDLTKSISADIERLYKTNKNLALNTERFTNVLEVSKKIHVIRSF